MPPNTNTRSPSDEIDLAELIRALWQSKALIIVITLIVSCMAAGYAFLSSPIYQTSVQTLPPTSGNLAAYNVASQLTGSAISTSTGSTNPGIEPITPDQAYKVFLRHMGSSTIRQKFFEENYLPAQENNTTEGDRQRAWQRLNKELKVSLPQRPNEVEAGITLEGEDPQTIAQWANTYVAMATAAAKEDVLSTLNGEVLIRKHSLEEQIATARDVARQTRKNHITRVEAALAIAESIGLESPTDGAPLITIDTQGLNTENINQGSLLYLRGAKALRSELQQLQERENDDAYIAELPNLQKKLSLINGIQAETDNLKIVTVDRQAIAPEDPIKPNKRLIVLLGLIIGGMLGVFAALLRTMLRR